MTKNIKITVPVNTRKSHEYTNNVNIQFPAGLDPMMFRAYVLTSIIDWFEEYDNQPKATELHPQ